MAHRGTAPVTRHNPETAPVTRYSRDPCYRAARLSALLYGLTGVTSHPGPGQRFLESPGQRLNEPLRRQCSSTLQSDHVPDGHDAQAVC